MNNNIKLPVVKFESTNETLENTNFKKVKIYIMHTGENLNGSVFTVDSINKSIDTLSNIPILAYVVKEDSQNKDFAGHETDFDIFTDEDGVIKVKEYYLEQPIGVIPETNDYFMEEIDGETYLGCYGYIWKCYSNDAYDILEEDQEKEISMEILIRNCTYDRKGRCHINSFEFLGITCLGANVPGAMGANCTINMSFSTDEENQEFFKSVDKLNKLLKCQREEGLSVDNIEKKEFAEDEVCPECGKNPCECDDMEDDVEENACGKKKCSTEDSDDNACKTKKCSEDDVEENACGKKKCSTEDSDDNACKTKKCEVEDSEDEACKTKKCSEDEVDENACKTKKCSEDDVEENACGGKKKNNEVEDSEDEACKKKCSTEDSEDNACKTKKCSEDDVEENACGKKNKCEVEDSDDNACGKKKNNEVEDSEDEACKTKKCSVETEEFALSLNNTFRAIRRCLDSYTYEYTSFWGDTYTCKKYYVEDLIPTESIAIVYDEEEGINYGIKYALDNDDVVLSMDDKRVYIQEWRAKEAGFSKFECDDKSKAKEEIFKAVGEELKELREFKANVEAQEAKAEFDAEVKAVLSKFNFEEEEISDLVEKVYNKSMDLEMFETFLFALEAKKTRAEKEKFSAREKENSLGVVDLNEVKEEPKTKYSNILEKYGKKNK